MEKRDLYLGRPDFSHDQVRPVGILIANLGTPDAPTAAALRPYLHEFLSDPRVIELPRWKWLPILHLFVLPFRPKRSAALYARVWTDQGSPLLVYSRRIAEAMQTSLQARFGTPIRTAVGMRYGNPSIASALRELGDAGCDRILVLPLFPQYFSGTTGSVFDAVMAEFERWRWIPELRTIASYHDDDGYIDALAASMREAWGNCGPAEKVIFSFHGIPLRYFLNGDPYYCHCQKTGRLLAERLGLEDGRWMVTFQSLFGREEWLKPYTDLTVEALARDGVKTVDAICPGFAADCLETIDEVGREARESFEHAGGERFRFVTCLNDRNDHVEALAAVASRHLAGWVQPVAAYDAEAAQAEANRSQERAAATQRNYPSRAVNPDFVE